MSLLWLLSGLLIRVSWHKYFYHCNDNIKVILIIQSAIYLGWHGSFDEM